jgi:hypothetical protein
VRTRADRTVEAAVDAARARFGAAAVQSGTLVGGSGRDGAFDDAARLGPSRPRAR